MALPRLLEQIGYPSLPALDEVAAPFSMEEISQRVNHTSYPDGEEERQVDMEFADALAADIGALEFAENCE